MLPIETSSSKTQLISISTLLLTRKLPLMSVRAGSLMRVPDSKRFSAFCLRYCCSRFTRSIGHFDAKCDRKSTNSGTSFSQNVDVRRGFASN